MTEPNSIPQLAALDVRIPKWDPDSLVERPCAICHAAGDPRYRRPDGLLVNLCRRCGAWYISPAPSLNALRAFYTTYWQTFRSAPDGQGVQRRPPSLSQNPNDDFRMRKILALINPRGKRCLDIGFGDGQFLVYFHVAGAEVDGLEWDESSVASARSRLPFAQVRRGDITDLDPARTYDVITMNNVIEHPFDPDRILRECAGRLALRGLLAVCVPNATFAEEETEPEVFRIKLEKLQFFSSGTFVYLAETLGLQLVHLECYGSAFLNAGVPSWKSRVRRLLDGVPLYGAIRRFRQRRSVNANRTGKDFLFCILRRPGPCQISG